jgi:hypothetical protein
MSKLEHIANSSENHFNFPTNDGEPEFLPPARRVAASGVVYAIVGEGLVAQVWNAHGEPCDAQQLVGNSGPREPRRQMVPVANSLGTAGYASTSGDVGGRRGNPASYPIPAHARMGLRHAGFTAISLHSHRDQSANERNQPVSSRLPRNRPQYSRSLWL